ALAEGAMGATLAAPRRARRRARLRALRPVVGSLAVLLILLVVWEGAKWLAGDRWDIPSLLGTGLAIAHDPPFGITQVNDINLPHVWDIVAEFGDTNARGETTLAVLVGAGLFTLRNAAIGFAIGATIGLVLAIVIVHVRLLERSVVPLLVISQTIPIIAIAPLIVIGLKAGWLGVAVVTAYLTFFPVTVAAVRGMRAYDPRAMELMRSYAAGRSTILRKLRLPASVPFLFTAFRIAATGSIVGAIVGELPSGIQEGLARQILTGMQYYTLQPGYLWAAIVVSSVLGIAAFLLVAAVERWVLRGSRPTSLGADT
ncbi:MAG TPA: ABC transporter permease subunit, partial [Gemmatimonadaceae bacterium]|nr:ABC transporter permease subunit [Gemmatimonadaceae bacterium]